MNLHELDPYFADLDIPLDLDAIYKAHVTHTHQRALETIFLAGFHFLPKRFETHIGNEQENFERLQQEFEQLQQKYDALNAKFNLNQTTGTTPEIQRELVKQAIGMGMTLGADYEQRS